MELAKCEDITLCYFRNNGFHISEWANLSPSLEWQAPIRVQRELRGRVSDAAIIVRADSSSYKQNPDWVSLVEVRRQLADLSIYFVIPDGIQKEPLVSELIELGIGLYVIGSNGNLTRVIADRVPFEDTTISYAIEPDLPYRNRINVFKVFNCCNGYLWWLDKHFLSDGFDLLEDWCYSVKYELQNQLLDGKLKLANLELVNEIPNVTEIRILGSHIIGDRSLGRLRRNFPVFKKELEFLGIKADIKILTDLKLLGSLHDRYIISDNIAFNVLPVGSLIRGQRGTLYFEEKPPEFIELWRRGISL